MILWRGPEQRDRDGGAGDGGEGGAHGLLKAWTSSTLGCQAAEEQEGGRCTESHAVLDHVAVHGEELRPSKLFLEISSIPFSCLRVR